MGAEFISMMGDGSGMTYEIEHDVSRIVVGDLDSIRLRLSEALEQLGYRVLNESPLQARRSGSWSAAGGASFDIREYPASLSIGLKTVGANAVRVTFAYQVKSSYGYLTRGDRNTITREAEALLAIAQARAASDICRACGATLAGGTRFCRQCGAPSKGADSPAEVEVLNLTAAVNTGYRNSLWGVIFLLVGLVFPLLLLIGPEDPIRYAKLFRVVSVAGGVSGAIGLFMMLNGLWKLRQALHQPLEQDKQFVSFNAPVRPVEIPTTSELMMESAEKSSVTEVTTNLLPKEAGHIQR